MVAKQQTQAEYDGEVNGFIYVVVRYNNIYYRPPPETEGLSGPKLSDFFFFFSRVGAAHDNGG